MALHEEAPPPSAAAAASLWKRPHTPSRSRLGQMLATTDSAHLAAPEPDENAIDHADIRAVEQHVAALNLAAPRPPMSEQHEMPPDTPAAPAAPWLQQWRLRTALGNPQALLALFCELSMTAARCFAAAGRLHTAASLRCDAADVMSREGRHAAAALLYEQLLHCTQGWHMLAAHTLPRMLRCQQV